MKLEHIKTGTISIPDAERYSDPLCIDRERELARSIKEIGLVNPITVRHDPIATALAGESNYILIAGYRRLAAWRKLHERNPQPIPAIIYDEDEAAKPVAYYSLVNDASPRTMKHWEIGVACVNLRDRHKLDTLTIARRIGLARAYVANLMRLEDHLIPEILHAYHEGGTGMVPSLTQLFKLATLSADEQKIEWDYYIGAASKPTKKIIDKSRRGA